MKKHINHSVKTCRINQKTQFSFVNLLADVLHILFTLMHVVMWYFLTQAKKVQGHIHVSADSRWKGLKNTFSYRNKSIHYMYISGRYLREKTFLIQFCGACLSEEG